VKERGINFCEEEESNNLMGVTLLSPQTKKANKITTTRGYGCRSSTSNCLRERPWVRRGKLVAAITDAVVESLA